MYDTIICIMLQVGKPVHGKTFIGREKEVKEILNYIEIGQSVVIIAPRRFGKTSLVIEVLRRLKQKKKYTGFIDIFEHSTLKQLSQSIIAEVLDNHGLKKLYQQTKGSISALLKNIKLKAVIEDFEFLVGLEDDTIDTWTNFSHSIDFINNFASNSDKQMCFAFDEYGDLLKFDKADAVIKLMRAKIQKQQSAVYIFSGSYESVMNTLFINSKSPFYRLAKIIHLSYLPFVDLKKYMIKMLTDYSVNFTEKLVEDSIDLLKGHPYYCQLALQQIYLYYQSNGKIPSIDALIDLIQYSEKNYFEKIWEDVSSSKEAALILRHLSLHSTGVYGMATKNKINASRTLKRLEGLGIIYKEDSNYLFYDPVFQFWIANTMK